MTAAETSLLQAGRLEQVCSGCGRSEAAGFYCTGCTAPMGPADWHRRPVSEAGRAGLQKARAARLQQTGAPQTPKVGKETTPVFVPAPPEQLALGVSAA
jgi:hypothetical protein